MTINIKKNIYNKRNELHMTQNEVAQKIGISVTAYRDLEAGRTNLLNPKIAKIASTFNISTEELVLGYIPSHNSRILLKEMQSNYETKVNDITKTYESTIDELTKKIMQLEKFVKTLEENISDKNEIIEFQRKTIGRHH